MKTQNELVGLRKMLVYVFIRAFPFYFFMDITCGTDDLMAV